MLDSPFAHVESDTLIHLGDTYAAMGRSETARDAWHEAWEILRELDHPTADDVQAKISALDAAATRYPGTDATSPT